MTTESRRKAKKVVKPFSWVNTVKTKQEKNVAACDDYFKENEKISILETANFQQFLSEQEVVLVMFHDPCDKNCILSKNHFLVAAESLDREVGAFASVNCISDPELCDREQVKAVPSFKLYSREKVAATVTEYYSFDHTKMRLFVENCPKIGDGSTGPAEKTCK